MNNVTLEEHPLRYSLERLLIPGKLGQEVIAKDPEYAKLPPALQKVYRGMYILPPLVADAGVVFGVYKLIEHLLK